MLLENEGFNVLVSQDNFDDFRGFPNDIDEPLLILFDVEGGEVSYAQLDGILTRYPRAFAVILADKFDLNQVTRAFEAGVHGYIIKEIPCASLMESLRLVAMGEKVLPSALAGTLLGRLPSLRAEAHGRALNSARALSDREIETLQRMSWGEPNKVIAQNLGICEATVKVHVKAILRKLQMRNRTQAVAWALNSGFDFDGRGPVLALARGAGMPASAAHG